VASAAWAAGPSGGAEADAGWALVTGAASMPRSAADRLVEAVLALQQLLDPAQEGARLGALDDAVGRRSRSAS